MICSVSTSLSGQHQRPQPLQYVSTHTVTSPLSLKANFPRYRTEPPFASQIFEHFPSISDWQFLFFHCFSLISKEDRADDFSQDQKSFHTFKHQEHLSVISLPKTVSTMLTRHVTRCSPCSKGTVYLFMQDIRLFFIPAERYRWIYYRQCYSCALFLVRFVISTIFHFLRNNATVGNSESNLITSISSVQLKTQKHGTQVFSEASRSSFLFQAWIPTFIGSTSSILHTRQFVWYATN